MPTQPKKSALSEKKTLIKITEGEEDLLVIPLISELPIKQNITNFVVYGQPKITDSLFNIPEGIALVEVNKKIKNIIRNLIRNLEKRN